MGKTPEEIDWIIKENEAFEEEEKLFLVSVDPFYSERNMAAIDEAAERIKLGCGVVKTMEELEAMQGTNN